MPEDKNNAIFSITSDGVNSKIKIKTPLGGHQTAKNKGKITNRVKGGTLHQENMEQSAEDKGEILNEVKKTKNPTNFGDIRSRS